MNKNLKGWTIAGGLGALGLVVAAVLAALSLQLVSQPVGLSQEPLTAGNQLAPPPLPTSDTGSTPETPKKKKKKKKQRERESAPPTAATGYTPATGPTTATGTTPPVDDHGTLSPGDGGVKPQGGGGHHFDD